MNCMYLILRQNTHNIRNGPGRFLNIFPVKSYPKIAELQIRTLYSQSSLGLDGFHKINSKIREEYGERSSVMNKLKGFENEKDLVLLEDLKVLIAFSSDDKNLVENTIKLAKRYFDQAKNLNIKPYIFGPILMRLLYTHDKVDEALELILDDEYGKFFHQKSTYQIVMDKLFKLGRYEEVKFLMNKIISEKPFDITVTAMMLSFGANYKIGTNEALENSKLLIDLIKISSEKIPSRVLAFAAGLALKLGKPMTALEILGHSNSPGYFLLSNVQVLAKARMGSTDEVFAHLKSGAKKDLPKTSNFNRQLFCFDVIQEIENIVQETINDQKISQFKYLKEVLQTTNLVSDQTLDEAICAPIHRRINTDDKERIANRVSRRRYED